MGVYKFIYILLFLKIFFYVLDVVTIIQGSISVSLIWCIVPSMFIGCFAYRASDLKTILALTTVSQMGYIISGLISHDVMAIKYALIYLLVYVLNLSGIFIIFVKLQKEFFLVNLNQLFLVKSYSKKWFYILFIIFASLAGFPPFAGFFLKYFLFLHIYKSGFFVLAAAGVISGYIMAIIYLQILMELSLVKTIA
jgi:NADH-quinone oxidoreductase subunit N